MVLPEKLPPVQLDRRGHEFGAGNDLICRGCGRFIWEYWADQEPCENPVGMLKQGISARGAAEAKKAREKRVEANGGGD